MVVAEAGNWFVVVAVSLSIGTVGRTGCNCVAYRCIQNAIISEPMPMSAFPMCCTNTLMSMWYKYCTISNIVILFVQCKNRCMAHSVNVREKAVMLRTAGYSYSYISLRTGLSKSTLSGWLGKIPYTPNIETTLIIGKALAASIQRNSEKRKESYLLAQKEAQKEIGILSQRDLFMFGLGLYVGEGSKTHDITRIANSDPQVIKFAVAWLATLGVPKKNLYIRLHLYPDSDVEKSTKFWMRHTGFVKGQFFKHQIDWRKDKKAYKLGKLPHGTAHLGVRGLGEKRYGVFLSRKILACIEEMAKKI